MVDVESAASRISSSRVRRTGKFTWKQIITVLVNILAWISQSCVDILFTKYANEIKHTVNPRIVALTMTTLVALIWIYDSYDAIWKTIQATREWDNEDEPPKWWIRFNISILAATIPAIVNVYFNAYCLYEAIWGSNFAPYNPISIANLLIYTISSFCTYQKITKEDNIEVVQKKLAICTELSQSLLSDARDSHESAIAFLDYVEEQSRYFQTSLL